MKQLPRVVLDTLHHFCKESSNYGAHSLRYDTMNAETLKKYLPKCFSVKKVKVNDNRPYEITLKKGGKIPKDIIINILREERDYYRDQSDLIALKIRNLADEV